ncbi:hypothetical protein CKN86_11370 [Carnobacterium divergens]|uniref:Uncharacterized protein n=1 Tax=Carnobacterium divergens TaxID=2748 RepID=A0A5F0MCR6_CARDV|nr:hypothetical protein CKN62_11510 [Carnobacterium divergens]TFI70729.1 hypothetical protein CKN81_11210 [Carnobacterium divergens]TFI71598.1 hypothetical protein CKN58_11250 [Carnobacterium divergens]TFI76240.1 hypothetical protein CKN85_11305 [Carnobacterium divergens]TFI82112.1 hypothetical protein CKN56_11330 [Carnobacterium divergens]
MHASKQNGFNFQWKSVQVDLLFSGFLTIQSEVSIMKSTTKASENSDPGSQKSKEKVNKPPSDTDHLTKLD